MGTEQQSRLTQSRANIQASASLADTAGQSTTKPIAPPQNTQNLTDRSKHINSSTTPPSPKLSCEQVITVSFFFDGTGNNLDADQATQELSNAAKLYLAHVESDPIQGNHRFYIPGIGTYFKDIGDDGGSTSGLAFGDKGQDRLEWAFAQFDNTIETAKALAKNPKNRIAMINVAAFGFSRGAALARAFARDFQKRCRQIGKSWELTAHRTPVRFYFLGLWDTVASVGLPMSSNNSPVKQSIGLKSTALTMQERNKTANGVRWLAFGEPGADPAPGSADGHASWAHPLDISVMVENCAHLVAAHEIRNSFPLDSCRRGNTYPANTMEMVYPGVHSDVGGGYRPGEGGRGKTSGGLLSLLPLRAMHRLASNQGVPLHPLTALPTRQLAVAFAANVESKAELDRLTAIWQHYTSHLGTDAAELGQQINKHMYLYYRWRFYKIRQDQENRSKRNQTRDQSALEKLEPQWERERQELKRQMDTSKQEADKAESESIEAQKRLSTARIRNRRHGIAVDPALETEANLTQNRADTAKDKHLKLKARYDTLPSSDGSLARNFAIYDDQLMADANTIRSALTEIPQMPIRPHYRNLLDAFEAEFVHNNGLRDPKVIEFFDNYVHDSLAAFAKDATLPSDPRVVYIGDDVKSQHASSNPAVSNG